METSDPLDVHRALREAGRQPFLFLSAGAHPEARKTIIACDPDMELRVHHGKATVDGEPLDADPLDWLQQQLDAEHVPGEQGFQGGWAGYFGYESLVYAEPTLDARHAAVPEILLRRFRSAIVFGETVEVHGDVDWHVEPAGPRKAKPDVRWEPATPQRDFEDAVRALKRLIFDGDHFQTNLSTRFGTALEADPADLLASLREANPSPYMALLEWDGCAIVSCSPELLFAREGNTLRARPIAGTRPRGATPEEDEAREQELLTDEKEDAEHTMLVDLVRNDLSRVCEPGSVMVAERKSIERYRHVMHLVSRVEGRTTKPFCDIWKALFPGGTITGAPKHRACQRIHAFEPVARGPYTGSAGWIGRGGDACFNILIRTMVLHDGVADVHAGSGIVADSDPAREWEEAGHKAQALLEAALGGAPTGNPSRLGETTLHGSWSPPVPTRTTEATVLLVDNYDSFTYNLAEYMRCLGARVIIQRNDAVDLGVEPTHIVLSPGPGRPEDSGATLELARGDHGIPTLGVCLGHQAIGLAHGARIATVPPVHGKTAAIHHAWPDLPSPLRATRYHSLVVEDLPDCLEATAHLEDGTIMAMRHRDRPLWGVQFHPESLMTEHGMEILARFLQ